MIRPVCQPEGESPPASGRLRGARGRIEDGIEPAGHARARLGPRGVFRRRVPPGSVVEGRSMGMELTDSRLLEGTKDQVKSRAIAASAARMALFDPEPFLSAR